jgi:hypothetical protein
MRHRGEVWRVGLKKESLYGELGNNLVETRVLKCYHATDAEEELA